MFNHFKSIILKNEYIRDLKHLDIDTSEIIDNIRIEIEKNKSNFKLFSNNSYSIYSPNILLENIIFQEVKGYWVGWYLRI